MAKLNFYDGTHVAYDRTEQAYDRKKFGFEQLFASEKHCRMAGTSRKKTCAKRGILHRIALSPLPIKKWHGIWFGYNNYT